MVSIQILALGLYIMYITSVIQRNRQSKIFNNQNTASILFDFRCCHGASNSSDGVSERGGDYLDHHRTRLQTVGDDVMYVNQLHEKGGQI